MGLMAEEKDSELEEVMLEIISREGHLGGSVT